MYEGCSADNFVEETWISLELLVACVFCVPGPPSSSSSLPIDSSSFSRSCWICTSVRAAFHWWKVCSVSFGSSSVNFQVGVAVVITGENVVIACCCWPGNGDSAGVAGVLVIVCCRSASYSLVAAYRSCHM